MNYLKKLYLDSVQEFKKPRCLAFCGIMGALGIVLGLIASIEIGPYIRIGFSGLPNRLVEALFGPVVGCIFGGTMDVLKFVVKPTGPFFFGFTFDAMLAGVIYGSILYQKPVSVKRIFLADFLVKLVVNCGFNTLWISILYGKAFLVILPMRILKNAIMLPVDTAIQYVCLRYVAKIFVPFGVRIKN